MTHSMRLSAALLVLAGGLVFANAGPAAARGGGGSNIMMSPGYQRALQESRERYRQSATQPRIQPSTAHKRKKTRHHGAHR